VKLAFSSNAYLKHPFDEAAARVAAIGYDGLELLADVPHAWPAGLLEGPKRAIREAMAANKLEFSNINAFMMNAVADHRQPYWHPSFIEPDPDYARVRIDHTRRALDLCAELGAPHITTEPGGPIPPGVSRAQAVDRFVEALKPLAEHAEKLGIMLLIEPEPELLLERTDQYAEIHDRVGSEALGLNFDVGHAFCMSENLPKTIAELAHLTKHYHLEDIAATRVHHHLVPGDGVIDFAEVVSAIKATGYDGWLTVELYPFQDDPDAAARRAFEILSPLVGSGAGR
jgi:sugar phosphate isomerase/epimerase